jgi:hypothetical protein
MCTEPIKDWISYLENRGREITGENFVQRDGFLNEQFHVIVDPLLRCIPVDCLQYWTQCAFWLSIM